MTSKVFILLISCLLYLCTPQTAPTFLIKNGTLGTITKYQMSYYLNNPTTTLTTFTISFAQSLLKVPNGTNNCKMWAKDINVISPICSCNAKICTFKPNMIIQSQVSLEIQIANITNPFYLSTQIIPVTVYFTSSINYNFNVSIPGTNYQPMQIIINNLTQSEFGVGSTPVTYTINVSLPYIAQNMQLSVSIPKQITYQTISSSLSFYETVQNSSPIQVQSILLYQLVVSNNSNPTGFMLLTLSGLCNPKFIGKSQSFKLTLTTSSCSTCKIAELTSGLQITSKDAGDVIISNILSTQNYISMETTLTLTLQLFAAIPTDGKVSIHLPASMSPVLPIFCSNVFGFIAITTPICKYNATANRIDTENFVTSSFDRSGTVILAIKVINPQDSRKVNFVVSTYDNQNRMIGSSRSSYSYNAQPLPLNATITKSQQQVQTNFNLEAQITLGKQLNISNNFMQILLPPVNYNLTSIKCYSAGLDLNCNKTLLSNKQLSITFLPPCTVCSTGNKLQFKIQGLKNPSYISTSNQIITVNTRNTDGIIESSKSTISIIPSNITLTSYTKPQNKPVGSSYNLQLSLNLPDYVKTNGGKIQIQFIPMSTYTNGQIIQNIYSQPSSSLSITLSNTTTKLNNNLQYNYDKQPYSIVKIIFDICDGTSSICTINSTIFNFTINGLKIGYIPSQKTTDVLQVTTSMGQIISEKTIDTSQYSPTLLSSTLSVAASVSMTNTYSDLQFNFTSNQVAIDKTINLSIPIGLQINGQCSINALEGLIQSFTCKKISDTMVQIDYSLDQNLMVAKSITFMIVLTNVSTPVSVAPLTYSLFTTYQGQNNQKFSSSYAMQNPLPLNHTFSKSNDTINQDFRLSVSIVPVAPIYDSFQLQISKSTVLLQQDWVPLFQLNETQTHYILTSQQKMPGNYVEIKARNSLSTSQSPEIYINLMYKGYLVQRSKIQVSKNVPVVLGCSVSVSNRTVSMYADLTVVCDRNNMGELLEEKMIVMLPFGGFNYESAIFNGSALNSINPKVAIPISITSPRIITIIISKVKNLLYIPNTSLPSLSFIQVTTTRLNQSQILGISSLSPQTFSTNNPFSIKNLSGSRNNLKSGQHTNISIDYLSELGDNGHIMVIELPLGQNTFISGESNCFIGTGLELCNVIRSNSTSITISLRPNSTILLTQLLNSYPNANTLQVSIYTSQQQLVSQGATSVLPAIALEKINLTGTSTTSESSSTNTIVLQIKPTQLKIDKDNIVVVTPPPKMFTRAFNTQDCRVKLIGTSGNFTGCNFTVDTNGWLESIKLGSFGPADVEVNSTLRVTFSVTNAWTSYPFNSSSFTVTVFKNNSGALSQGTLPLINLFPNSTSFKPPTINKNTSLFNQSQLQASSPTTITINIKLNGNIGKGTKIWFMLPKDTYIFNSSDNVTLEKQDISYYYVSKSLNCTLQGCQMYSQTLTLQITNNFYVKKQRNNLIVYGIYDGLPCTDQFILSPPINTPMLLPQLSINRNSSIGAALSTITIDFSLSSTPASNFNNTNFNDINIDISKDISNANYPNTQYIYSIKQSNSLSFTPVAPTLSNTSTTLTFLLPGSALSTNQIHRVTIIGQNNIEVPIGDEIYNILVQNSTHFLFAVPNFKFNTKLQPIGQGLTLFRQNPTVGVTNNLTLKGNLQTTQSLQLSLYTLKVNQIIFGPLTNPIVSLPLFSYTNPSSSINQSSFNLQICNISHCIYKQSQAKVLPKLASIQLTSNEVNFSITQIMDISSIYKLKVVLTTPLIGKKFISILTDDRLYASIVSCMGSYNNSGKTQPIQLQYSTIKLTDTNGTPLKQLIIKSNSSTISLSQIEITFKTNPYQIILPNSPIKLISQLPTVQFTKYYNFHILGKTLNASLNPTSIIAKSISNYTITIQPLIREGVLSLIIPQYISKLFIGANQTSSNDDTILQYLSVKNNGNSLPLTGINSQLAGTLNSLYLLAYDAQTQTYLLNFVINTSIISPPVYQIFIANVTNPPDNRHLIFNIYQHELEISQERIYAYRQFDLKIQVQDRVHVYSGIRNVTKIGAPIELVLDIETINALPDELLIKLSTTQVIITQSPCLICIDSACNITSTPSTTNSITISKHVSGRHKYLISGCIINSMFSQEPTQADLIYVGVSMPYQTAQTNSSTSTYITPLISTGDIQISGIKSSNNNRAQYTTLSFTAQPENWENCDGMLIEFEKLAYIVHQNLLVKVNGKVVGMNVVNSSLLYLQIGSKREQIMNVEIANIINYIQNAGFTIRTLKKKTSIDSTSTGKLKSSLKSSIVSYTPSLYGIMDLITLQTAPISFVPLNSHARIIFPDNYLSGAPKKIIIVNVDDLPIEIPSSSLSYSFGSSQINCKFDNLPYNKTITITCATLVAGTANFSLHLLDSKLSNIPLTSFTKSIYIYPEPKGNCDNVMCDLCSDGQSGSEYCFSCRQGLYSLNGECVHECPTQNFPYNDQTCVNCSPDCSQCFDIYDNSCLSCQDSALLLDSGTCTTSCSSGYAYQSKYCVNSDECSTQSGCRLCSSTGFCYECLPDYDGQPTCTYFEVLPKTFFIFFMLPILIALPLITLIGCIKVGANTFSHLLIFLFSFVEITSWIFVIPKMPQQALAMIMCSFLLIKIIVSIVSYETYYNKLITRKRENKLLGENQRQSQQKTDNISSDEKKVKDDAKKEQEIETISHKERLVRFTAHFLGCDAYQLLMYKWGKPFFQISHFTPFLVVNLLNRAIVLFFLIYVLVSNSSSGDLLFLPIIAVVSGLTIILTRILNSNKVRTCMTKIRG